MENFHNKSIDETLKEVDSSNKGLSQNEASERLIKFGENKLKEVKKKSWVVRFLSQFKDVMIILLLISAVLITSKTNFFAIPKP